MAYYVCSGAKPKCSIGSEQSELEVVHIGNPVLLCGSPMNITVNEPTLETQQALDRGLLSSQDGVASSSQAPQSSSSAMQSSLSSSSSASAAQSSSSAALREKLTKYKGNISKVAKELLGIKKQPQYNTWIFPFGGDIFEGLTIAINDTWAYETLVTEYQSEKDGPYKGKLKIVIYDHFGLDDEDVQKVSTRIIDGFFHWFVLQRWKEFNQKYKPFVTVIEKELPFKGNWREL